MPCGANAAAPNCLPMSESQGPVASCIQHAIDVQNDMLFVAGLSGLPSQHRLALDVPII